MEGQRDKEIGHHTLALSLSILFHLPVLSLLAVLYIITDMYSANLHTVKSEGKASVCKFHDQFSYIIFKIRLWHICIIKYVLREHENTGKAILQPEKLLNLWYV